MATKQRARRRRAAFTLIDGELDCDASNNTLETDPINRDSDGDMLWDGDEAYPETIEQDNITNVKVGGVWYNSSPIDADTDNDGLSDYHEVVGWDVTIIWEATLETVSGPDRKYSNPNINDTDGDGLFDGDEYAHSSNPTISDSDGDNLDDKEEVDIGSDPVGMDGVPPVLSDLSCWVDPIVEKGANKIPYLAGLLIKITVDVTDPACVHYIELEIQNKTERVYVQESQEKTFIGNTTINITMDYYYGEREPLTIRVADFCGNVNDSVWVPSQNWLNFREQHWADPEVYLECVNKTYSYDENNLVLPNQMIEDIEISLFWAIQELKSSLFDAYFTLQSDIDTIEEDNKYINFVYILYEKWRYAGKNLFALLKSFESENYKTITTYVYLLSSYKIPIHLSLPFNDFLKQLYNDLRKLEKNNFENLTENIESNFKSFSENRGIKNYLEDYDGNNLPDLLDWTYGHGILFGTIGDYDDDGISDYDEIRVLFRSSLDNNDYTNGWVAFDIGEKDLACCKFESSFKTDNAGWHWDVSLKELYRKGSTPEGYPYIITYLEYYDAYKIYIFKDITINFLTTSWSATICVYEPSCTSYNNETIYLTPELSEIDCSPIPNAVYCFNNEVRLCPGAIPIVKDIFVEVDWMAGWVAKPKNDKYYGVYLMPKFFDFSDSDDDNEVYEEYKMSDDAQNKVISAFKKHGIVLHIDDGDMGGGEMISLVEILDFPSSFESYYLSNSTFSHERRGIYHYCIFAPYVSKNGDYKGIGGASKLTSGRRSNIYSGDEYDEYLPVDYHHNNYYAYSGDYFAIADASQPNYYQSSQSKKFMHELGHNLGLGWDESYGKNYRDYTDSIMDYDNFYNSILDYSEIEWEELMLPFSYMKFVSDGKVQIYQEIK